MTYALSVWMLLAGAMTFTCVLLLDPLRRRRRRRRPTETVTHFLPGRRP